MQTQFLLLTDINTNAPILVNFARVDFVTENQNGNAVITMKNESEITTVEKFQYIQQQIDA